MYLDLSLADMRAWLDQFIAAKMRENEIWKGASEKEFDNAVEAMEKLVMNRLYHLYVRKNQSS